MKQDVIRIGSRESKLAVVQANMLLEHMVAQDINCQVALVTMKTTGDIILDRALDKIGGKGLFVKELDLALLEGRTDLSVHSLKDVPMEMPEEFPLLGFSKREDPRDVLVLPAGVKEWNPALPIGCSSRRRILQMEKLYPNATFKSVRGNVQTRLSKLDSGQYSALILAAAGLYRLGLEDRISRIFTAEEIIPAAGQGILAVQGRKGMELPSLQSFFDSDAASAALCERAFVRRSEGGCSSPTAAYAVIEGDIIHLTGLYYDEESGKHEIGSADGKKEDAEVIGCKLAETLIHRIRR